VVDSGRAYLGVELGDTRGQGAYVGAAATGGPAADAGIRAGDVITEVAGRPTPSAADLAAVLADLRSGRSVSVKVRRADGSETTLTSSWASTRGRDRAAAEVRRSGPRRRTLRPTMAVQLIFETHSISLDNECGVATGWLPGELSERGRLLARALGERRRGQRIACVFSSDLRRAADTAEIAFAGAGVEIRTEWRLRECDYGRLNGAPAARLAPRRRFVERPFPGGESYRGCVERMRAFLRDVAGGFDGRRVLVVSHSAPLWALRHLFDGVPLEQLVDRPVEWQEGWEYTVPSPYPARRRVSASATDAAYSPAMASPESIR